MIDLHCHILPGIDDGPKTIEDSIILARAMAAKGVRTVLGTSHVNWHYTNDPDTLARLTMEVNQRLREEGIELEVLAGAEVAMTYAMEADTSELERFRLGDGPWTLIEPPFTQIPGNLDTLLLNLQHRGLRILLAHPERCPAFHRDPQMLQSLVDYGFLTSITAGSLTGRFGSEVRRFSLDLVRKEMVHNVASDAHDHVRRPPGIAEELEQSGLGALTSWFTEAVPAAILRGEEIPSRPQLPQSAAKLSRRSRWSLRGALKRAS